MRAKNAGIEQALDSDSFLTELFSKLIQERIIFLNGEITTHIAASLTAVLFYLNAEDPKEPITIYINSVGGDAVGLLSIYDAMNLINAPIKTVVLGEASSAGAIILAAGSPGERYASKNSRVMIHQIQLGTIEGSKSDVENQLKPLKDINKQIMNMLARHTGQTYEKISRDCKVDKDFSAEEALKYGLVDKILPYAKQMPALIKSSRKKNA